MGGVPSQVAVKLRWATGSCSRPARRLRSAVIVDPPTTPPRAAAATATPAATSAPRLGRARARAAATRSGVHAARSRAPTSARVSKRGNVCVSPRRLQARIRERGVHASRTLAVGPALSALREAAIVPPDLESLGRDEEQQHDADREGNAVAVSEEVRPDPEHGCERKQPVAEVVGVAAHARESRTRPIGAEGERQLAGRQLFAVRPRIRAFCQLALRMSANRPGANFSRPPRIKRVLPIGVEDERQLAGSGRSARPPRPRAVFTPRERCAACAPRRSARPGLRTRPRPPR